MTLRIEVALYQPAQRDKATMWLNKIEVDETLMAVQESVDLDLNTGIADDDRPLFMAIRVVEGVLSTAFPSAYFTFQIQKATHESYGQGDKEDSDSRVYDPITVKTVTADWTSDWKPYFVAFNEGTDISRVQVYWGDPLKPE